MCFSAGASFSAAAVLGTAGIVSLTQVTKKSQIMFASIPLLFGIQQASEGALWLALSQDDISIQHNATYVFLFFAQMLWTTWIPLSFLFLETDKRRRKILELLSVFGIFTSGLLGYRLITQNIFAEISGHHIKYEIESPQALVIINSVLYVSTILLPCFISSVKKVWILGLLLTISLLVTKIFYEYYLISVWCFFAASLSVVVIYVIRELKKESAPVLNQINDTASFTNLE